MLPCACVRCVCGTNKVLVHCYEHPLPWGLIVVELPPPFDGLRCTRTLELAVAAAMADASGDSSATIHFLNEARKSFSLDGCPHFRHVQVH